MDKRQYIANELRRVFSEHTEIATLGAEVADKMAQAAIAALEPVTVQDERERIASIVETWRNDVPMTGKECAAAIRALAERGE